MNINSVYFLQIILCICQIVSGEYYRRLRVTRSATTDEIKKKFRVLALEKHPDKNKAANAQEEFEQIRRAYDVLSNPTTRRQYDRCGESCLKKEPMMDSHATFASFFEFASPFDSQDREDYAPRGANVVMHVGATLEELYSGHFVEMLRVKPVPKQASGTRKCNCRQEMTTRNLGNHHFQMIQQTVCDECPNVKMVNEERSLEIEVEPGMKNGHEIRFPGEGEPHIDGEPGDLIIKIKELPHQRFYRKNDDLYTNVTISLQDALIGFTMTIPHLDGHKVTVAREKITWPGARIIKTGEGMPNYDNNRKRGKLHITFDIAFPKKQFTTQELEDLRRILEQKPVNRIYNEL